MFFLIKYYILCFLYLPSQNTHRATRTEIKILSTVDVAKIQKQADDIAKEVRLLDNALQASNWTVELEE